MISRPDPGSARRVALLLRKDLLLLRRSPLLLALLLAYPLLIGLLVGAVAGYATSKPRVAFVDRDGLPAVIEVGGERFRVADTLAAASRSVTLVPLEEREAKRQLGTGRVVAIITVPPGFVATLRGMVRSPRLEYDASRGAVAARVEQQVQALVYNLNRQLQEAYIEANLRYIDLLVRGGTGRFLDQRFETLGLDGVAGLLEELPRGGRLDEIREFVREARLALAQTDNVLEATANPIRLERGTSRGRTIALSAQVQAYALALTISFLGLLIAAGSLAAERDENVFGRLARGLVGRGELVLAKAALAAVVSLALGLVIALSFGVVVELGGVEGGEPWRRLPLVALGLVLAGAGLGAFGALLGTLAREARTASLLAVLVVLPLVFLGLVPRGVVPLAAWVSDAFPFVHAQRFFAAALTDLEPWATLGEEALWLAGLGAVFAVLARIGMRRLST